MKMVYKHVFLFCIGLLWLGSVRGLSVPEEGKVRAKRSSGRKIVQEIKMNNSRGVLKTVSVEAACLTAHNKVRALHKRTKALVYDQKLAQESAEWALHLATLGKLEHSKSGGQYGENLFSSSSGSSLFDGELTPSSPARAVFAWYKESWIVRKEPQLYNYKSESNPGTGHFTQVVWKKTTRVGCGVAVVENGGQIKTYIVARYAPFGNLLGQYVANVKPMKSSARPPKGPADIDTVRGCVNYGTKCDSFKNYCQYIAAFCQCTCG